MSTRYECTNTRRKQLVRAHSVMNGIDYLEVLDTDAIALGSPRQRTLLIRFIHPAPDVQIGDVRIEGGARSRNVSALWAVRGSEAAAAPLLTAAEQNYFSGLPDPAEVLLVRTNATGDYSTYTLTIRRPETELDPRLSTLDFSFKVECPSTFDCAPGISDPIEHSSEPLPNYLAKDYASFRQLMLDRMATVMPEWVDRNPADVGLAIVELLAYAADRLSYFQDAVATETYLGTARRRVSVRRHARLLDYRVHEGCNARAWLQFDVEPASDADGAELIAGTLVSTLGETDHLGVFFETMRPLRLQASRNILGFYTWGDDECTLPKGGLRATVLARSASGDPVDLELGDVLIFEEQVGPTTGVPADASPLHRHPVRLTSVRPGVDPLTGTEILDIAWSEADRLPFQLRISPLLAHAPDGSRPQDVSVARGNVVLADHGSTVQAELLEPAAPAGSRGFQISLRYTDITFSAGHTFELVDVLGRPVLTSAYECLHQDARGAVPQVRLTDVDGVWEPRRDLLASGRFAREFVVETEDDGTATLRFGDGQHGRHPVNALTATYRVGNGPSGNVGADSLIYLPGNLQGIRVRNPLPAVGGLGSESPAEVRSYAPQAFRTQQRAVTLDDYTHLAETYPDVQKAQATLGWSGSWNTVLLTVDRRGGAAVDAEFQGRLRAYMERFRLAGADLQIGVPIFVPLEVAFTVCVAPGYFASDVEQAVLAALSSSDLPDGTRGFFHPDNFTFAQSVYQSQVLARAMAVPGVLWIDADQRAPKRNRFGRTGASAVISGGVIRMGRLEIARLNNDPNVPEGGNLKLFMRGGV